MQPNDINLIEGTIDRNLNGVFYMMNRAIGYNFGDLAAPANQVSGIISNSETGEIIENAQVKILEMDGGMLKPRLSDEFGRYRRLLSNGSYTMQISAEGYYSQEIIVNSSSATITYRNIELNPRQNYVLELNLNIPENYQLPIYIDIVSDVKTYTYNINDGINLLDLYADNYQLKVYSQDLFTQFFEYNLFENSTFYIDLNYSETIFEENFDNLNNWSIISGNWSLENGNLVSQTSLTYDEGAFWKIKYNEDIFVNDNVQVNLVLDFKKEFEWEHDYAFFDFDANNNSYEFYAQDHNWNQHKLEIPIDNINQLIIGIYADSTVQYRGLEIDNLKLVSQPLLQESNSIEESLPQEFKINRIAPNPFNPSTLITYQIPENGEIKIEVLNVAGQKIENIYSGYKKAGKHEVKWHSKNISSGFYFVKIHLNERISKTEKVMLLK